MFVDYWQDMSDLRDYPDEGRDTKEFRQKLHDQNERLNSFMFGRRNGSTTRLIDEAVQELFTRGEVRIRDHYGTRNADQYMLNIFLDRLKAEHFRGVEITQHLYISRNNFIVKFKKDGSSR